MKLKQKISRLSGLSLRILLDVVGALILSAFALIVGPLGFLRGPLVLERVFAYFWVLAPLGLLAKGVRVAIDWRTGHFVMAIAQAEVLISQVERSVKSGNISSTKERVLTDLYTLLTRAYMHIGHVDEAMQVVIRASKILEIDKLSGLPELDAKTAHLVRAGLAAGRLLEGGGLATMFVKSSPRRQSDNDSAARANSHHRKDGKDSKGAKVIPFPLS